MSTPLPQNLETPFVSPKRTAPARKPAQISPHSIKLSNRFEPLKRIPVENISCDEHLKFPPKSWQPSQRPPATDQPPASASNQPPTSNHPPASTQPPAAFQNKRKLSHPFINQHPENEINLRLQRVVPAERVHSKAIQPPGKIALLGDSNFHGIREDEMASWVATNPKIVKMAYSGATAAHLLHIADIALIDHNPETMLILGGTNDVFGRNKSGKTAAEIATDLTNIGKKCRAKGVKNIFISSLPPIEEEVANQKVKRINSLLKIDCSNQNFIFISNDFLTKRDLKDPVHLSWNGRRKLVDNYISHLNKY